MAREQPAGAEGGALRDRPSVRQLWKARPCGPRDQPSAGRINQKQARPAFLRLVELVRIKIPVLPGVQTRLAWALRVRHGAEFPSCSFQEKDFRWWEKPTHGRLPNFPSSICPRARSWPQRGMRAGQRWGTIQAGGAAALFHPVWEEGRFAPHRPFSLCDGKRKPKASATGPKERCWRSLRDQWPA